ncbi:Aste57867_1006 [Aphanomyces stellatus]|uniref:Cyclin-dependent kinase 2 homolog n=1 Tax=Aphanomyces stellatus TaxID=120398 RepID=A0A485K5B9_9STRA|nr:hypothetical protein As57867_001005 [Aphanomyces stellatus]VFT78228.1 Aste57867_1006 [Aphanomyces stellatus]
MEYGTPCSEKYTKVKCIGAGTYGRVYEARNRVTGEIVALKKIKTLNESEGVPVTTLREIIALKSLQHPNLVEMKEIVVSKQKDEDDEDEDESKAPSKETTSDYSNGSIYLVLEFVSHDLTGLLQSKHSFSDLAIKYVMKQLLEALQYMHDRDFVHRDIKTSNILLTPDYSVKLADYGLARTLRVITKLTNKVVTLWYRAPELLLGSTDYDASVDMWSIGCVFAELFLGRPLFQAKTDTDQMAKIVEMCGTHLDEVNGISHLPHFEKFIQNKKSTNVLKGTMIRKATDRNVTLPKGFVDLLDKLLQIDPRRRFSAAQALNSDYFKAHPQLNYTAKYPHGISLSGRIDKWDCRSTSWLPTITDTHCHEMSARKMKKEGAQAVLNGAEMSKKKALNDKANAVLSFVDSTKRPPSKIRFDCPLCVPQHCE